MGACSAPDHRTLFVRSTYCSICKLRSNKLDVSLPHNPTALAYVHSANSSACRASCNLSVAMASVMASCNPCTSGFRATRRAQVQARPCGPASFVRFAIPVFVRPSAFNRYQGWDEASADAMRDMFSEMYKQWKSQQGNVSGGIYWPGGGYTFKGGRWMPCQPNQSSKDNTTSSSSTDGPSLPLDVVSTGDFYLLYADVPGLAKSDLSIKLTSPTKEPRLLKVSGQRNTPWQKQEQEKNNDVDNEQVVQQQRVFGSFAASWELPADADSEGISAKVSEGVLTITVPKKQQQPQPEEEDDSQDIFIA